MQDPDLYKAKLEGKLTMEYDIQKSEAEALVKTRCKAIERYVRKLSQEVNKIEDWEKESNLSITRAMAQIKNWEKDLENIVDRHAAMKDIVATYCLDPRSIHVLQSEVDVDKTSEDVKMVVKKVKAEDF